MRTTVRVSVVVAVSAIVAAVPGWAQSSQEQIVRGIIEQVPPLDHPLQGTLEPIRGSRLELSSWLPEDDEEARAILQALHARGVAVAAAWAEDATDAERLSFVLRLGRLQQESGVPVSVNARSVMHGFFSGAFGDSTLHVDEAGEAFSWSLYGGRQMGCPFRLEERQEAIKQRWVSLLDAYVQAGIDLDFVYMDWYADGPVEWNEGWQAAQRCVICRERIPQIEDFRSFQRAVRRVRGELQRYCAADPVHTRFPDALVGNWAVYPNDGWRDWYDFYETIPEGAPYRREQLAWLRPWADEFSYTGYSFANPVCYPWHGMYAWYPDYPTDFRWFYMLLRTGSRAARSTPRDVTLITWVKWHPTPAHGEEEVPAMSLETYHELLAHLLLRGNRGFLMWCPAPDTVREVGAMAPVLNEALRWREFFEAGEPVVFHVPRQPGTVISALRLGDRLLVRRTDFADLPQPVVRNLGGVAVSIPPITGRFFELQMPQ